jgi:hypothetical protein
MAEMFANGCSAGRRALKDADTDHAKTLRRVAADRAAALVAYTLETGRAERCADTVAEQAEAIVEQAAANEKQAATIAELEAKIARLEAAARVTTPVARIDGERRRAAETEDVAPIVSGDGVRRACATDPCGLEGICLNGGGCSTGAEQVRTIAFALI